MEQSFKYHIKRNHPEIALSQANALDQNNPLNLSGSSTLDLSQFNILSNTLSTNSNTRGRKSSVNQNNNNKNSSPNINDLGPPSLLDSSNFYSTSQKQLDNSTQNQNSIAATLANLSSRQPSLTSQQQNNNTNSLTSILWSTLNKQLTNKDTDLSKIIAEAQANQKQAALLQTSTSVSTATPVSIGGTPNALAALAGVKNSPLANLNLEQILRLETERENNSTSNNVSEESLNVVSSSKHSSKNHSRSQTPNNINLLEELTNSHNNSQMNLPVVNNVNDSPNNISNGIGSSLNNSNISGSNSSGSRGDEHDNQPFAKKMKTEPTGVELLIDALKTKN